MADKEIKKNENEVLKKMNLTNFSAEKMDKITEAGLNARERYLEVELNGAGVLVGVDAYTRLKGQPSYEGSFLTIFPALESHEGTVDSTEKNIFNVTAGNLPKFTKGLAGVLYNKSELETLNTEDDFNKLADPNLVETIPITAIAEGKVTLQRQPLDPSFTNIIILDNDGFIPLAQLTNFDANESQDEISTDTQSSGGYKSAIGGLKSASIEGITGLYAPVVPSAAILATAYNLEAVVRVRNGAAKIKNAPYSIGMYKVTEFTTTGETSGNAKLEFKASLKLQSGQISKKVYK